MLEFSNKVQHTTTGGKMSQATIPQLLESNYNWMSINDFIVQLYHHADKAETHEAFKGPLPEYVTIAPKLRQMADDLGKARDAADGGDRDRTAEKMALWATSQMALSMNAYHIVMLSLYRNDPGLLGGGGYEPKQKKGSKQVAKQVANLLDLTPEVFVKHGVVTGGITILVKRIKSTASIELQMTYQDPSDETSWMSTGGGIYNRSRIELKDLELAKRIHLRARYHEDGKAGRWSSTVSIIVI